MVHWPRKNSIDNFTQVVCTLLKQYSVYIETRITEADLWILKEAPFEPLRAYINKFREIIAKISHPNEVVALAALKNGVWFSSKFREELAVREPISLDDARHRASYFTTHEEEVTALKEQYNANKNNVAKKTNAPKEPAIKGQHSYAINNLPQNKSSTYDLNKFCASITVRVIQPKNVNQHFAVKVKIKRPTKIPKRKKKRQQRRKPIKK